MSEASFRGWQVKNRLGYRQKAYCGYHAELECYSLSNKKNNNKKKFKGLSKDLHLKVLVEKDLSDDGEQTEKVQTGNGGSSYVPRTNTSAMKMKKEQKGLVRNGSSRGI